MFPLQTFNYSLQFVWMFVCARDSDVTLFATQGMSLRVRLATFKTFIESSFSNHAHTGWEIPALRWMSTIQETGHQSRSATDTFWFKVAAASHSYFKFYHDTCQPTNIIDCFYPLTGGSDFESQRRWPKRTTRVWESGPFLFPTCQLRLQAGRKRSGTVSWVLSDYLSAYQLLIPVI